jgi:prepilin-type N-terminal cleavage/methylation domain-containing protein
MNKIKSGFTLVEVLITTLIFSIVMLSMYSVFHTGRITYKKMDSAFDLYQKARIIFNRLDQDLRNSFVYKKNNAGFSGTREGIDFFTLLNSFDNAGGVFEQVSQIKYEFQDPALRRTQLKGLDILKEGSGEITFNLINDASDLSFQFAAPNAGDAQSAYTWQDIWPRKTGAQGNLQEKTLPLAVKVEMILEGIKFIKIIPLAQSYLGNES